MNKVLFLLVVMFSCATKAYEGSSKKPIHLSVGKISLTDDSLSFTVDMTNKTTSSLRVYSLSEEDLCYGILRVNLAQPSTGSIRYFPCSTIYDLDEIVLDKKNSNILSPSQTISTSFVFADVEQLTVMKRGPAEMTLELALTLVKNTNDSIRNFNSTFSSDTYAFRVDK